MERIFKVNLIYVLQTDCTFFSPLKLCYTVGPHQPSTSYIVVYIRQSQSPNPSHPCLLVSIRLLALSNRSESRDAERESGLPKATSQGAEPGYESRSVGFESQCSYYSPGGLGASISLVRVLPQLPTRKQMGPPVCSHGPMYVTSITALLHYLTLHLRAFAPAVLSTWNGMLFPSES